MARRRQRLADGSPRGYRRAFREVDPADRTPADVVFPDVPAREYGTAAGDGEYRLCCGDGARHLPDAVQAEVSFLPEGGSDLLEFLRVRISGGRPKLLPGGAF